MSNPSVQYGKRDAQAWKYSGVRRRHSRRIEPGNREFRFELSAMDHQKAGFYAPQHCFLFKIKFPTKHAGHIERFQIGLVGSQSTFISQLWPSQVKCALRWGLELFSTDKTALGVKWCRFSVVDGKHFLILTRSKLQVMICIINDSVCVFKMNCFQDWQ